VRQVRQVSQSLRIHKFTFENPYLFALMGVMENQNLHTQYLSAGELGDILGINLNTVLVWARKGIIPCLRLSSRVIRFDMKEVEASLREKSKKETNKCSLN